MKFRSRDEERVQLEKMQGDMSVKEYVNRFNELARFEMEFINT